MKKRIVATAVAAAFFLAALPLFLSVRAANPYFVAVNDSLLDLGVYTPISSGGLYIPGGVFNEGLGVNYFYSGTTNIATVFSGNSRLVFDLSEASCRDGEGFRFPASAISRDGKVYLPLDLVCGYFGLTTYFRTTDYGPLLRLKSGDAVLSDDNFVSAARIQMKARYEEWTGTTIPTTTAPVAPSPPRPTPTPTSPPRALTIEVCVTGSLGGATADFLAYFDQKGVRAAFFIGAQSVRDNPGLVREIYARGHLIGTNAASYEEAAAFNDALDSVLMTRSRLVIGPSSLAERGYTPVAVNVYGGVLSAKELQKELEPYINGDTATVLFENDPRALEALGGLMTALGTQGRITNME